MFNVTAPSSARKSPITTTAQRKSLRAAGYDPIPIRGKRPPMNGWQKLARADDKEIETWPKAHPGAKSTGILTEKTPALDIDILDDAAATAVETLTIKWFAEHGKVMIRYGNAPKRAILFRTNKPFRKITVNLVAPDGSTGQKLELLGQGQQLVAFGIHPDTKKPYQWIAGEPGTVARSELPLITEAEARKLVNDAADLLCREYGYKRGKERPKKNGKADSATAASDWALLMQNIRSGAEYHDSLRDLSAKMIRAGMSGGAVVNMLHAMMDSSDGKHDVRWFGRREDIKRLVAGAEGKTFKNEGDVDDAPASVLEYFKDAIAEERTKNWLIKNVVALAETSSWVGPPKSGKSALLVDLCLAIARGQDWRDYLIKKQAGVVYFALERGDLVKRRLKGHAKRDGIKDTPFAVRRGIIDLMSGDSVEYVVETINEAAGHFGCDVGIIVIDTFSKAIAAGGGEENSAKDQNIVSANLRRIQEATGVHIATVGHTGKDESRGARGSNAHLGDVDVMVQFAVEEDNVVKVEVTGANDQPEIVLGRFKLEPVDIGHDEDGELISTHIVDPEEHGKHEAEKRLPPQKQRALDILHSEMKTNGSKSKSKDGQHYVHQLGIQAWKTACRNAALSAGDDKSFERVFRDCVNRLIEWQKIEIIDGNIRLLSWAVPPPDEPTPAPTRNGKPMNVYQLFGLETQQPTVSKKRINTTNPQGPADHGF